MPMRQALLLCPDALVLRGDMETGIFQHSALVRAVIDEQAPLYEQASIDEFYLDLTGMDKHIGCWKWSLELRERIIKETGLPLSFGLSVNKTVSKVGTGEAKPERQQAHRGRHGKDFSGAAARGENTLDRAGNRTPALANGRTHLPDPE